MKEHSGKPIEVILDDLAAAGFDVQGGEGISVGTYPARNPQVIEAKKILNTSGREVRSAALPKR